MTFEDDIKSFVGRIQNLDRELKGLNPPEQSTIGRLITVEPQSDYAIICLTRSDSGGWTNRGMPTYRVPWGTPVPCVGDYLGDEERTRWMVIGREFEFYSDGSGLDVHLHVEENTGALL